MEFMAWEDIGRASAAWREASGAPGSAYDEFRGKFLPLPEWFVKRLDPRSDAYLAQQDRLWREMVGSEDEYVPVFHELTLHRHIDPIVRAGLYSAPTVMAGEHLIALGHNVKYSEATANSRILEYGAGFGQIAVTFARLGAEVHTVDVDSVFCGSIAKQAEFFKLRLTPHEQVFGYNPGGRFISSFFTNRFTTPETSSSSFRR